jgi:hypothetical protein
MDESSLIRLDLRAPLEYENAPDLEPFVPGERDADEKIFCFELDPAQSRSIEPGRECFLGSLVFAGRGPRSGARAEVTCLPAGLYLFTQKRMALDREACIDLAIEQQKDGLWERLEPADRLYVRYLFEDGSRVTQLFRPYRAPDVSG